VGAEGAGLTGDAHATRRRAARRNVAKRIRLAFRGRALEAWVLNVSRGGLRLLLESPLVAGDQFEAHVPTGDDFDGEPAPRPVRVVWADRQADGTIAGVEFLDVPSWGRIPVAGEVASDGGAGGPASTRRSGFTPPPPSAVTPLPPSVASTPPPPSAGPPSSGPPRSSGPLGPAPAGPPRAGRRA
jgi:hypothetical protein